MHTAKQALITNHQWLVFDEQNNSNPTGVSATESALAYEDAFIRWLPELNQAQEKAHAILHLYPIQAPTILLGAKDQRLTNFNEAIAFLKHAGYHPILRSHGGLAVVNDPGVTNFALITDNDRFSLNIEEAYEQMVLFVSRLLQPYGLDLQAYEIEDSYCPGTYDLVVEGRKIGGVAQRRFKSGLTTAAYISVNGNQTQRANLIHEFYHTGQADDSYPHVKAEVMASLSEFLPQEMTVTTFHQHMLNLLRNYQAASPSDYQNPELIHHYHKMLEAGQRRNQVIL